MKRRLAALGMAGVLTASMLAGCSRQQGNNRGSEDRIQ